MPYTYTVDKQRRLVNTVGTGVLTLADIVSEINRSRGDTDFDPDYCELADLTEVTDLRLDPDDIRQLSSYTIYSPGSKRAIVAPRAHIFGMSRMFELMRDSSVNPFETTRVFSDRDEALQWLAQAK
jgi:hypothetical protein